MVARYTCRIPQQDSRCEENPQTHDAIQPVPRDGRWMKRHESMNSRVAEGNVDLVFIGDSITQVGKDAGGNLG